MTFILYLLVFAYKANATPLLTPEERNAIEVALKISKSKDDSVKKKEVKALYLSGILYTNPENWTIWVNDKSISADSEEVIELGEFKFMIASIDQDSVTFQHVKDGKTILISLYANQSYLLDKDKIVDGQS